MTTTTARHATQGARHQGDHGRRHPGRRRHRAAPRCRPGCPSSTTWSSSWAPRLLRPLEVTPRATFTSTRTTRSRTSGIVLGGCLAEALGDKAGIRRFASMLLAARRGAH